MISRRKTRQVKVGEVLIGGDAPVAVQSMTSGYTHDIDACVREINKLAAAGADIVRVAVPEKKDTLALKEILGQVSVPIVADVHFHFQRALEAVEAGVHKIRLNPGNINDRKQVEAVIDACRERHIPIRIGVNEGSIVERKDKQKRMKELGAVFSDSHHGHLLAIMITKLEECRNFQEKVRRGEARLGEKLVDIIPPDPLGELGSGYAKIAADKMEAGAVKLPIVQG